MKRFFIVLIALLAISCQVRAKENVEIYIDNEILECDTAPVNINERVLVPMRAIFEALDTEVYWNGDERTVWVQRGDEFMCIPIDGTEIGTGIKNSDGADVWVDTITIDVPAMIISDRTYVPVRAVSETLGAKVSWNGEENRVQIERRAYDADAVYYTSLSDYGKLYSVSKNGLSREKISDKTAYNLIMYNGDVYYSAKEDKRIYRANRKDGESIIVQDAADILEIDDGYIYYQKINDAKKHYGEVYRMSLDSGEAEQLTDIVQYPKKYKNYIYYNIDNDNKMYALTIDTGVITAVATGDEPTLHPFNCMFYGDHILMEDGFWYGHIIRMDLDGSNSAAITRSNSIIFKDQLVKDRVLYLNPEEGQDIYSVDLDGNNLHLVHKGDASWTNIEYMAEFGDTVYFRHPMHKEIYSVNMDGSGEEYIGYADDLKVFDGKVFTSYNGLYIDGINGESTRKIYDREVADFVPVSEGVYLIDKASSKIHFVDYGGNRYTVTADAAGEWVY